MASPFSNLSALNHPNVCAIPELAQQGGRSFLVMEFFDGATLKNRIGSKALDTETPLPRPSKLLTRSIQRSSEDPWLAKVILKPESVTLSAPIVEAAEHLTTPGSTLGTIAYLTNLRAGKSSAAPGVPRPGLEVSWTRRA